MDYANVYLLGRAVNDAKIFSGDEKITRAIFDLATNIPVRKDGKCSSKPIFHRVVVWGYHADYVAECQETDSEGIKGRLIIIVGNIDSESYTDPETNETVVKNIIRVGNPNGQITIVDRRKHEEC